MSAFIKQDDLSCRCEEKVMTTPSTHPHSPSPPSVAQRKTQALLDQLVWLHFTLDSRGAEVDGGVEQRWRGGDGKGERKGKHQYFCQREGPQEPSKTVQFPRRSSFFLAVISISMRLKLEDIFFCLYVCFF